MKVTVSPPPPPTEVDINIFYEHRVHRYWEDSEGVFLSLTEANVQEAVWTTMMVTPFNRGETII
jgi:hypothetical protein